MKTEKLIYVQHPTHHNSICDENSYIPVTLLKTQEEVVENLNHKTKAVHIYKNYHS